MVRSAALSPAQKTWVSIKQITQDVRGSIYTPCRGGNPRAKHQELYGTVQEGILVKPTAAAIPQTSDMAVCGLRSFRIPQGPDKDKNSSCDSSCSMMTQLAERRTARQGKCRSHRLPGGRGYLPGTREGIVRPLPLSVAVKKFTAAMRRVKKSGQLCPAI